MKRRASIRLWRKARNRRAKRYVGRVYRRRRRRRR